MIDLLGGGVEPLGGEGKGTLGRLAAMGHLCGDGALLPYGQGEGGGLILFHHIGGGVGIFRLLPGEESEHHLLGGVMIAGGIPVLIFMEKEFHGCTNFR